MKKEIRRIINQKHSAVVEFENSWVTIWIEEKYKWLCFDYYRRVSWVVLFELGKTDDTGGCDVTGIFAGRVITLPINHRNIDTFNLKYEVDTLYHSFIKSQSEGLKRAKLIDNIINQLD